LLERLREACSGLVGAPPFFFFFFLEGKGSGEIQVPSCPAMNVLKTVFTFRWSDVHEGRNGALDHQRDKRVTMGAKVSEVTHRCGHLIDLLVTQVQLWSLIHRRAVHVHDTSFCPLGIEGVHCMQTNRPGPIRGIIVSWVAMSVARPPIVEQILDSLSFLNKNRVDKQGGGDHSNKAVERVVIGYWAGHVQDVTFLYRVVKGNHRNVRHSSHLPAQFVFHPLQLQKEHQQHC
jgi:hypothetical protein